jgi:protein-tyrosine kinase
VSRIFQAQRQTEKINGNNVPSPPLDNGGQWHDLMPSLEPWSVSDKDLNSAVHQSVPGRVDNPSKTFRQRSNSGEQCRDLSGPISLRREIIEHAEPVICQPRAEERVLASGDFPPFAEETFRVLCQRLLQVRQQRPLRTVLVTSAVPREGKTVVAINLAGVLARNSSAVLLVDGDLRHPQLPVLGIVPGPGLADYLVGQIEFTKAIRRVDPLGFYYVAAGFASTNPAELFQKPALEEFINQAAAAFDWVIFDSPAINLFADARHLAALLDGVLLVVRENVTPKELAEKSLVALEKAFVLGMVFNASTASPYAHYDLAERSYAIEEGYTDAAMKQSQEKSVDNDSIVSGVSSDQEGRAPDR